MKIPAITIYQPWASLSACGAKQYETRSWATKYRGRIAIHAAKKPITDVYIDPPLHPFANALKLPDIYSFDKLPRGCIIATAELVDCRVIWSKSTNNAIMATGTHGIIVDGNELLFGDWTPGRYAWELRDVKMLAEPIPAKGKQRLWYFDMPDDVLIKECGGNE